MTPRWIAITLLTAFASVLHAQPTDSTDSPPAASVAAEAPKVRAVPAENQKLSEAIQQILADKLLAKGQASVEVVRLGESREQDRVVFQHQGKTALIPASNLKLLSTAAAVHFLGADFQFTTRLAIRTNPDGKVDAAIIGDGDPSTGDSDLFGKLGRPIDQLFRDWAGILAKQNITKVDRLLIDDSVFGPVAMHPNWPPEQAHFPYVAQVGGLNLNANCLDVFLSPKASGAVDVRVEPRSDLIDIQSRLTLGDGELFLSRTAGTNNIILRGQRNGPNREPWRVTIHDPSLFAGSVCARTFITGGVNVRSVERDATVRQALEANSPDWVVIAQAKTPIGIVLDHANKESANLYAEALARRTAFKVTGTGDWPASGRALSQFLAEIGVNTDEFSLDDGCGLSKNNRISANALAAVLSHMHHSTDRELFFNSLSQGGVDGTLSNRFNSKLLAGKVAGKSGFVRGVSALSGYLKSRDGSVYVFSILLNGVPSGQNSLAKAMQDRIVAAIENSTIVGP